MKKILLVVLLTIGLMVSFGERGSCEEGGIYFKSGNIELTYPLSNLSAISLYDVWKGEGLIGGETQIAKWLRLNINVGVITSLQADGCGFISLDYDWAMVFPNMLPKYAKLGIFFGRDFKRSESRAGIKASTLLF